MTVTAIAGIVMISLIFVTLAFGFPIGLSIGLGSAAALFIIMPNQGFLTISAQKMFQSVNSFSLLAIPFFVLAGNIMNTGGIARQRPASVTALGSQYFRHEARAGGLLPALCTLRNIIAVAVQRDQRPDRTVESLNAEIVHIGQSRCQINTRHSGGIVSGRCQAEDGAGVFRGLRAVEPTGHRARGVVRGSLLIRHSRLVREQPCAAQSDHRPLAANRTCGKRILLL